MREVKNFSKAKKKRKKNGIITGGDISHQIGLLVRLWVLGFYKVAFFGAKRYEGFNFT